MPPKPDPQTRLREYDPALAALDRNQEGLRRRKRLSRGQTYLTDDKPEIPPADGPAPPALPSRGRDDPAPPTATPRPRPFLDEESEAAPFPRKGEPTL